MGSCPVTRRSLQSPAVRTECFIRANGAHAVINTGFNHSSICVHPTHLDVRGSLSHRQINGTNEGDRLDDMIQSLPPYRLLCFKASEDLSLPGLGTWVFPEDTRLKRSHPNTWRPGASAKWIHMGRVSHYDLPFIGLVGYHGRLFLWKEMASVHKCVFVCFIFKGEGCLQKRRDRSWGLGQLTAFTCTKYSLFCPYFGNSQYSWSAAAKLIYTQRQFRIVPKADMLADTIQNTASLFQSFNHLLEKMGVLIICAYSVKPVAI